MGDVKPKALQRNLTPWDLQRYIDGLCYSQDNRFDLDLNDSMSTSVDKVRKIIHVKPNGWEKASIDHEIGHVLWTKPKRFPKTFSDTSRRVANVLEDVRITHKMQSHLPGAYDDMQEASRNLVQQHPGLKKDTIGGALLHLYAHGTGLANEVPCLNREWQKLYPLVDEYRTSNGSSLYQVTKDLCTALEVMYPAEQQKQEQQRQRADTEKEMEKLKDQISSIESQNNQRAVEYNTSSDTQRKQQLATDYKTDKELQNQLKQQFQKQELKLTELDASLKGTGKSKLQEAAEQLEPGKLQSRPTEVDIKGRSSGFGARQKKVVFSEIEIDLSAESKEYSARCQKAVRDFRNSHQEAIARCQKHLMEILYNRTRNLPVLRFTGSFYHRQAAKLLAAVSPRAFRQTKQRPTMQTEIVLLIDCSGSMSDGYKLDLAVETAQILYTALSDIKGLRTAVYGFTADVPVEGQNRMYVIKTFDESGSGALFDSLVRRVQSANNDDEAALNYVHRILCRRAQNGYKKLVIVLSDGHPACRRRGMNAMDVRKQTAKMEVLYPVLSVGICSAAVKRYYSNWRVLENISELPEVVMTLVQNQLQGVKQCNRDDG